ncbi:hypothetical protein K8R43_04225 [archaeon]|nr:hypothetical protein [archaeon]
MKLLFLLVILSVYLLGCTSQPDQIEKNETAIDNFARISALAIETEQIIECDQLEPCVGDYRGNTGILDLTRCRGGADRIRLCRVDYITAYLSEETCESLKEDKCHAIEGVAPIRSLKDECFDMLAKKTKNVAFCQRIKDKCYYDNGESATWANHILKEKCFKNLEENYTKQEM